MVLYNFHDETILSTPVNPCICLDKDTLDFSFK